MKKISEIILKKLRRGKDVSSELKVVPEVTLVVKMGSKNLARLFYNKDEGVFCLVYMKDFLGSGIVPFHSSGKETSISSKVDLSTVYRNKDLWYAFASRIPNVDRSDYKEALDSANLTGDESPLVILGKLSNYSISSPWKFEVCEEKAA